MYVDGAHRYAPARADIVEWGRKIPPGGTLLVHDSFSAVGVTLAQLAVLVFGREFRYTGRSRSLTEYRREDLRGAARAVNALRQLSELGYFARNVLDKALITLGLGRATRWLGGTGEWPY